MTDRLPLRVRPLPGEWWRSYLRRVASVYASSPEHLLRRIDGETQQNTWRERTAGISVSDHSAARLGALFNIPPQDVVAMHLKAYNGSVLRFGDRRWGVPAKGASEVPFNLQVRQLGPLVNSLLDRACQQCAMESPGFRAMSWRLRIHLVCTRHRVVLRSTKASSADVKVPAAVVTAQQEALIRLVPSARNAQYFAQLELQMAQVSAESSPMWDRLVEEAPEPTLEKFCEAVARTGSNGYPDYQGISEWPIAKAARFFHAPDPLGNKEDLSCFPHLLPMHLFDRGLGDLLQPADLHQARMVAAIGVVLAGNGASLDVVVDSLPAVRRRGTATLFLEHLVRIEREGRAERFWGLCQASSSALVHEAVDYRARASLARDRRTFSFAQRAVGPLDMSHFRAWLVDQWACTFTQGQLPRASVRDGTMVHFEAEYGKTLRRTLGKLWGEQP